MQNITQHYQAAQTRIKKEFEAKRKAIIENCNNKREDIFNLVKDAKFSHFAVEEISSPEFNKCSPNNLLPEFVRVGELKRFHVPLLYLYSQANATSFLLNDSSKNLMNPIALRLMCSLPSSCAKFYFSDNNFGSDFSFVNSIDNQVVDYQVVQNTGIEQLLEDMSAVVTDFYRNSQAAKEVNYFIFISNFPAGFTPESVEKLRSLINEGNARKAGIFFFLSFNEDAKMPFGMEMNTFIDLTTCMNRHQNGAFPANLFDNADLTFDSFSSTQVQGCIQMLNKRTCVKSEVSFEKNYSANLKIDNLWKSFTTNKIKIPIGYAGRNVEYFEMGEKDFFGLIGGLPGMGKTVLLHNIIVWGACEYSPSELKFCLIDCKNGTGMNVYRDLPHTLIQSTSNDRGFGESALQKLIEEMKTRAELFKAASEQQKIQIENIQTYRKVTGKQMPRILTIIDEFQVLFEKEDKIGGKIGAAMDKIFREGRAFGIHVLLCSQGIRRIYNLNIANITWRLAFKLQSVDEATRILGNDEPLRLSKVGNAIINNQNGDKTQNIKFQVGFIENVNPFVEQIIKEVTKKYPNEKFEKWGVSDGSKNGKIQNNLELVDKLLNNQFKINDRFCDIYIGEPVAIRQKHSFLRIRKQACSNVLLIGNDLKSAVNIVGLSLYQLAKQSSANSKFYLVDNFNIDNEYAECFDFAKPLLSQLSVSNSKRLEEYVDEIDTELNIRIQAENQGDKISGRIVLFLLYAQNCRALRKEKYNDSPITAKIKRIIADGPEYGIHVFLHTLNYQSYSEIFERCDSQFENKILLDNNEANKRVLSNTSGMEIKDMGTIILQISDELAEVNPDLCRVYSEFKSDSGTKNDFITQLMNI